MIETLNEIVKEIIKIILCTMLYALILKLTDIIWKL